MSKSRKSFPGMIVPLIIRRWHKINIPNTSRPSAMTHGMMKRKREKPCQKPFPSFLPCYEICIIIIVTSIKARKREKEPFLLSEDDIHTHALKAQLQSCCLQIKLKGVSNAFLILRLLCNLY